jgi:hypothetical protein
MTLIPQCFVETAVDGIAICNPQPAALPNYCALATRFQGAGFGTTWFIGLRLAFGNALNERMPSGCQAGQIQGSDHDYSGKFNVCLKISTRAMASCRAICENWSRMPSSGP